MFSLCFHFAGSGENLPDMQSHVAPVWTIRNLALCPDSDQAEQLPVLSHKLPFFS